MTEHQQDVITYFVAAAGMTNPWWTDWLANQSLEKMALELSVIWLAVQILYKFWSWIREIRNGNDSKK